MVEDAAIRFCKGELNRPGTPLKGNNMKPFVIVTSINAEKIMHFPKRTRLFAIANFVQ